MNIQTSGRFARAWGALTVLVAALVAASLYGAPDPEIFDGSRFPAEQKKPFALGKILQNVKLGLPGAPSAGSGRGQGDGQGDGQGSGPGGMGGQQGGQIPTSGGGGAIGGEMDQGNPGMQGGRQGRPGQQGALAGGQGGEMIARNAENAVGGEMANAEASQSSSGKSGEAGEKGDKGGQRRGSAVTIGDASEMIEGGEEGATSEDGAPEETLERDPDAPAMAGRNKGRASGVEQGEAIPTDI